MALEPPVEGTVADDPPEAPGTDAEVWMGVAVRARPWPTPIPAPRVAATRAATTAGRWYQDRWSEPAGP